MAREKRMRRKHTANAQIQILGLTKAGSSIEVDMYADGEKLGRLVIDRGSLKWFGHKWKNGRRFSWSAFASHMDA